MSAYVPPDDVNAQAPGDDPAGQPGTESDRTPATFPGGPVPPGSRRASLTPLLAVFWATSLTYLAVILLFFVVQGLFPESRELFEYGVVPLVGLASLLGFVLIVMAVRAKVTRGFRLALIWTGISAVGIPLSAVLHNVIYGLAIAIFGKDVWGASGGGDEAVFFILALIVFPVLLIVFSVVGNVIYARQHGDVLLQGK